MDSSSMQLLVSHNLIIIQHFTGEPELWQNANLLQHLEDRAHPGDP